MKAMLPIPQGLTVNQMFDHVKLQVNELVLSTRSDLMNALNPDPRRDLDAECGYPASVPVEMFQQFYDRNEFGHRVVSVLPEESWALPPVVYETQEDDLTEFEKKIEEIFETPQLNLWYWLRLIDELSGIGHYGVLLLGFNDGLDLAKAVPGLKDDGTVAETTTNEEQKGRKLIYLRPFAEIACSIKTKEDRINNPRFGQPVLYTLKFKDFETSSTIMVGGGNEKSLDVHWTRVLHVADNCGMSRILGTPRMKVMFNRLLDIRKILGGSGEMFWKGGFPGLSFELAPGSNLDDSEVDKESIREELNNYMNGLQRYLALAGMSAKSLASEIADPTSHMREQIQALCISLGVPLRVFLGSEEAKIASTQDQRTWNKRLKRRQDEYLTPWLVRPLIQRLIDVGVLPKPEKFKVRWGDLNTTTDQERSANALTKTQAIAQYIQGNCDQVVPPKSFFKYILEMEEDEAEEIQNDLDTYDETIAAKMTQEQLELMPADPMGGAAPGKPGAKGKGDKGGEKGATGKKRKVGSGGTHRAEVAQVDAVRSTDRGGP